MKTALFPTKGNLILAKNRLKLSREGYELLDKKRNILVREMMLLIEKAEKIQSKIDSTYTEAYKALQAANIMIGISTVMQISHSVDEEDRINIKTRSIMGVEIPIISIPDEPIRPQYSFATTTISLDEAYSQFEKVKQLTIVLAEVESAVYRLAINIKRTQKRANALKNIMIPRYEELVKYIQNYLEEKDREEFTRLKIIKQS